jgi:hypothetical protein
LNAFELKVPNSGSEFRTGLPDNVRVVAQLKTQFWYILVGLEMENFARLVFVWPFGTFYWIWNVYGQFGIFFPFMYIMQWKIWRRPTITTGKPCPHWPNLLVLFGTRWLTSLSP